MSWPVSRQIGSLNRPYAYDRKMQIPGYWARDNRVGVSPEWRLDKT